MFLSPKVWKAYFFLGLNLALFTSKDLVFCG